MEGTFGKSIINNSDEAHEQAKIVSFLAKEGMPGNHRPTVEQYNRAQEALDELLDSVEDEEKWGTVGNFCKRALIVGGVAPLTLGKILGAFAEGISAAGGANEKINSIREAFRDEMASHASAIKEMWANGHPAADELDSLKEQVESEEKI